MLAATKMAGNGKVITVQKKVSSEKALFNFDLPSQNIEKMAERDCPIKWRSEIVKIGYEAVCRGWVNHTPTDFVVIRHCDWNLLEDFQQQMTSFYEERRKEKHLEVTLGEHLVNTFVAVYRGDRKHKYQWYRCHVESMVTTSSGAVAAARVYHLDYGEYAKVLVGDIRKIPEAFIKALPAIAIKCSMSFNDPHYAKVTDWPPHESTIFKQLMQDCRYFVKFQGYTYDETDVLPIRWKCEVSLQEKGGITDKITVEQLFYGLLAGKTMDQVRGETDAAMQAQDDKERPHGIHEGLRCLQVHKEFFDGINEFVDEFQGIILSRDADL